MVRSMFAQWRRLSTEVSLLFQILVSLVTISDWPRRDSWQHFYTRGLPTKKLQATVPTSLSTSHTLHIHSKLLVLQKNRCMRKELKLFYLPTKHLDKTSSKHLDNSFHIPPLFWDAKHKRTLTIELNRLVFKEYCT